MEKKINIAEILKDCPKGMKLYSPIFGEVYLDKIRPHLAIVVTTDKEQGHSKEEFLYDGRYGMNGECMLFPSKGITTWKYFKRQFNDGDVVAVTMIPEGIWIGIFNQYNKTSFKSHCSLSTTGEFSNKGFNNHSLAGLRFATEEEKQKLFDTIKANGYKWNPETKTLEKLVKHNFKVGNIIRHKASSKISKIIDIRDDSYITGNVTGNVTVGSIPFSVAESDYELIQKFDISTLIPFESMVLVRDDNNECWIPAIWALKKVNKDDIYPFVVVGGNDFVCCIPYDDNQHLIGKTGSCDEFYKTWE